MYKENFSDTFLKKHNSAITLFDITKTIKFTKKYDSYIIKTDNFEEFKKIINLIEGTPAWNPNGYFLIITTEKYKKIFDLAWKKYILNINIINNDIYTYFPFDYCENITIKKIGNCINLPRDIFPEKIPNKTNCILKETGNIYGPFVKDPLIKNDNAILGGFEVALINILSNYFNMSVTRKSVYFAFGVKLEDGNFTGILKMLMENECDLAYGHLIPNVTNYDYLDNTMWYFQDEHSWHVPASLPGKQWKSIFMIFNKKLLGTVFLALIFNCVIWRIFGKFSSDLKGYKNIIWCCLHSWYILLLGNDLWSNSV